MTGQCVAFISLICNIRLILYFRFMEDLNKPKKFSALQVVILAVIVAGVVIAYIGLTKH